MTWISLCFVEYLHNAPMMPAPTSDKPLGFCYITDEQMDVAVGVVDISQK